MGAHFLVDVNRMRGSRRGRANRQNFCWSGATIGEDRRNLGRAEAKLEISRLSIGSYRFVYSVLCRFAFCELANWSRVFADSAAHSRVQNLRRRALFIGCCGRCAPRSPCCSPRCALNAPRSPRSAVRNPQLGGAERGITRPASDPLVVPARRFCLHALQALGAIGYPKLRFGSSFRASLLTRARDAPHRSNGVRISDLAKSDRDDSNFVKSHNGLGGGGGIIQSFALSLVLELRS